MISADFGLPLQNRHFRENAALQRISGCSFDLPDRCFQETHELPQPGTILVGA